MRFKKFYLIATTTLLIVMTPILIMTIITLGNNLKDRIANEDSIVSSQDGSSLQNSDFFRIAPTFTPVPTYTPVPTFTPVPLPNQFPTPEPSPTPIPKYISPTPLIALCTYASPSIPKMTANELKILQTQPGNAMFLPSKIFGDETTKLVTFGIKEIVVSENSSNSIELFDDGTHGDNIAGDNIFSRACLDRNDLELEYDLINGQSGRYTLGNAMLNVVHPSLRDNVPFEQFSENLFSTENVMFYALSEKHQKAQNGSQNDFLNPRTCLVCIEILKTFGDVFDHLIFVPDNPINTTNSEYLRISDNVKGIMTYGDKICNPTKWENQGKNESINEYYLTSTFGCPAKFVDGNNYNRLKGNVWFSSNSFDDLNENLAKWVGIGPKNIKFPGNTVSWNSYDEYKIGPFSSVLGPLTSPLVDPQIGKDSSLKIKNSANETTDAKLRYNPNTKTFTMVPIDEIPKKYDDILLYMMGLKSYDDAQKRYFYLNPQELELNDCETSENNELICNNSLITKDQYGQVIEFGVKEMVQQFGERDPIFGPNTINLNSPVIILTKNLPSDAERAYYHTLYKWWGQSSQSNSVLGLSYKEVTSNLGEITTGIPR